MDSLELLLCIMGIVGIITVGLFISFNVYYEMKDVCNEGSVQQITSEYVVCGERYETFTEDEGYTVKVRHWKVPR